MKVKVFCKTHGRRVTHDLPINCLNPYTRQAHATKAAYDRACRHLNAVNGERLFMIQTPAIGTVVVEHGKDIHIVL